MKWTITRQVALLFFLSFAGISVALGIFYVQFARQSPADHFSNMAGRQRMLSEQLGAYAYMVYMGQEEDRAPLRGLIAEFDRALRALERALPPAPRELGDAFARVRSLWSELRPALYQVADAPAGASRARDAYDAVRAGIPRLREASHGVLLDFEAHNARFRQRILVLVGGIAGLSMFLGGITGICTVRRYVAERNQQEEALRESEKHFQDLLAFAPDAIVVVDEAGRITQANLHVEALFGHSREALIGQPIECLVPERFRRRHEGLRENFSAEFRSRPMGTGQEVYGLRKDGREFRADITLSAIKSQGSVWIYCAIRDITALVQMQQELQEKNAALEAQARALRESEEKVKQIMASAQDAIVIMDARGLIAYWNKAAERIFGYTAEEALGRDTHALLAPERYHKAYRKGFEAFKMSGRGDAVGKALELTALKKGGMAFPVELSMGAVHVQGAWHAIGVVRDITDRKRMEKAQREAERLRVLTQAAGGAAHEINQPLTVIVGYAELLLNSGPADDSMRECLATIKEAAKRISGIVRNMQEIRRYATQPYADDVEIVNYDAAAGEER